MNNVIVVAGLAVALGVGGAIAQDASSLAGTWNVSVQRSSIQKAADGPDWIVTHFARGTGEREVSLSVDITEQDGI